MARWATAPYDAVVFESSEAEQTPAHDVLGRPLLAP
jgi:hypothetical protein